jgi:hypothetical protein
VSLEGRVRKQTKCPLREYYEIDERGQCSRLKPSYEFHFEVLSNLAFQLKGWVESKTPIQEHKNEIQNSY